MFLISARTAKLISALALGFVLLIGAASVARSDEAPGDNVDELVRVKSRNLDHLFVAPDADFAGYRQVMLDPVDVSFSDRWDPNSRRSRAHRRLSDRDIEALRSTVATEFEKSVAEELGKGGYTLVDHPGDDVLRVTPSIVNLYITAPSQGTAGRSRTYVANTGHMTLVADLRDSVTGEHLARAIDTQQGRRTGTMQLATSVSNMADARRAFTTWARALRTGLDDARESAVTNEDVEKKEKVATKDSEGTPR